MVAPTTFAAAPFLSDIQSWGLLSADVSFYPCSPTPYAFNVFVVFHFLVAFVG